MQISRITRCHCGADLRPTRSNRHLTTTIDEGSHRYLLFHCPSCGTLHARVDERVSERHSVGVGA